jgi:hypothetical protein
VRADGDGQRGLDRSVVVAGLALDAREAQVAADHQQAAAVADVLLDRGQPVRGGFGPLEGGRGQEQAVRADVAEDDRAVLR